MTLRLVTLDLDGTLLPADTAFGVVLRHNGHADLAERMDREYEAGKLTMAESYWQEWDVVRGLSLADCHRALRKADWLPGIPEGVQRLKSAGLQVCLLTDQPSTLTDFLGRWGLTDAICSPAAVHEGRIVGFEGRLDKLANLKRALADRSVALDEVCHVGDGPNDIPVFHAVGGSVAVGAGAHVAKAAQQVLQRPKDLGEVVDLILKHYGGKMESKV